MKEIRTCNRAIFMYKGVYRMKWTAIGVAVTAILCFSSAFAGNGTIRVNVEKDWWSSESSWEECEYKFVRAKCRAEDGHATTHWEKVRPNSHKTCHGAYHMRVDIPEFIYRCQ